jgi:hypothetical protein
MNKIDIQGLVGSFGSVGLLVVNLTEVLQQASLFLSLLGSAGALFLTCISIAKQLKTDGKIKENE